MTFFSCKSGYEPKFFRFNLFLRALFLASFFSFIVFGAAAQTEPQVLSNDEKDFLEKNPVLNKFVENAVWPSENEIQIALENTLPPTQGKSLCPEGEIRSFKPMAYGFLDANLAALIAGGRIKMAWFVNAIIGGCGKEEAYRFIVLQMPDDSYASLLSVKGRTHAWPTLIKDAMMTVFGAVAIENQSQDCLVNAENFEIGPFSIKNDNFIGPLIFGIRYTGSWEEMWKVRVCETVVSVPIKFRADGQGGAFFEVSQNEVTSE